MEEKKEKTPSPFEEGERLEDKDLQSNGIMQNGLEDGGFRSVGSVRAAKQDLSNKTSKMENEMTDLVRVKGRMSRV